MENVNTRPRRARSNSLENDMLNTSLLNATIYDSSLPTIAPDNEDELDYLNSTLRALQTELHSAHTEIENLNMEATKLKECMQRQEKQIEVLKKINFDSPSTPGSNRKVKKTQIVAPPVSNMKSKDQEDNASLASKTKSKIVQATSVNKVKEHLHIHNKSTNKTLNIDVTTSTDTKSIESKSGTKDPKKKTTKIKAISNSKKASVSPNILQKSLQPATTTLSTEESTKQNSVIATQEPPEESQILGFKKGNKLTSADCIQKSTIQPAPLYNKEDAMPQKQPRKLPDQLPIPVTASKLQQQEPSPRTKDDKATEKKILILCDERRERLKTLAPKVVEFVWKLDDILLLLLSYVKAQILPLSWSWPTEYQTLSRPVEVKCLKEIMKHDTKIGDENFLHVAGSNPEIYKIINNIYINEDTDITIAFYRFNGNGLHYVGTFKTKRELFMKQLMKYQNYVLRNFHHLYDDKGKVWIINKLIVISKGMRDLSIFFKNINDKYYLGDHNIDLDYSGDTIVNVVDIDQPALKEKVPFATDYKVNNNFDKKLNIFNSFGNGEVYEGEKVNNAKIIQYIPNNQLVNLYAKINYNPYIEQDFKMHPNLPQFQPLNVLNTKPYYENSILNKVAPQYDITGRNIPFTMNYQWNIPSLGNKNFFYIPNNNVGEVKRLNVHDSEYEPVSFGDIKILNSKLNKPLPFEFMKNANDANVNYRYKSFTPRYIEIKPTLFDANSLYYNNYRPTFCYNLESDANKLYKVKTPDTYVQNNQPYAFYQPSLPMVFVRNNDDTNIKDVINEPLQYDSQMYQSSVPVSVKPPILKSNINTQPSRFPSINIPNLRNYQYMRKNINDPIPVEPNLSVEVPNDRIMSVYNGIKETVPIKNENFEESVKMDTSKQYAYMMPNYEQAGYKKQVYDIQKDKYEINREPNIVNVGPWRARYLNWPFNGHGLLSPHIKEYDAQVLDNQISMPININNAMHNSEENMLKEAPFPLHKISQFNGNINQFSAEIPNVNYLQESNTGKNKNNRIVELYNQHPFQWQNALYGPSYYGLSNKYQRLTNGFLPNNVPVSLKQYLNSAYPKDKYPWENSSDGTMKSIPYPNENHLTEVNPYAEALKLEPYHLDNEKSVTPKNYLNYFKNNDMYAKESEVKKKTCIQDLYEPNYNTVNVEAFNLNQENNLVNVFNKANNAKQKANNYNSYGGNKYLYNINQNLNPVLTEVITNNNPQSVTNPNEVQENMRLQNHVIKLPGSIAFRDKAEAKTSNTNPFNYYQQTTEIDTGTKYNEGTGNNEQMIENDVPDSYLSRKKLPNQEIINIKAGTPSVGNMYPYYVQQLATGDNMYNKIRNIIDSNIHTLQPGVTKTMNTNTVRQMQALLGTRETLPENLMKAIEPNVFKVINNRPYPIFKEDKINDVDTSNSVVFPQMLDMQQTDGAPVNSINSNVPVNYEQLRNVIKSEALLNPNYLNHVDTIPIYNGILNRNIPQYYQMQYPFTNTVDYNTRSPLNIAYYRSMEPKKYDPTYEVYNLNASADKSVQFKNGIKEILPYKTEIHRTQNASPVAAEFSDAKAARVAEQPRIGHYVAKNYVTPMEMFRNPVIPIAGIYNVKDCVKSKPEYNLFADNINENNYYKIDKTDFFKDSYNNKGMNQVEYNPYNVQNSIINKDESAKDLLNFWKPNLAACAEINNERGSNNIDGKRDPAIASYFYKPNNIYQPVKKMNEANILNNIPFSYNTGVIPSKQTNDLQRFLINPSNKLPNNNYWYTNNNIDTTKITNARYQSENGKTPFKELPEPLNNGQIIFDNNNHLENPYYYTTEPKTKSFKSIFAISPNKEPDNTIEINSKILDYNHETKPRLIENGELNYINPNAYQFGDITLRKYVVANDKTTKEAEMKPFINKQLRPVNLFAEKAKQYSEMNIKEAENANNDKGSVLKRNNYGTYLPAPNDNILYVKNEEKTPIFNNYHKIPSNTIQKTQNYFITPSRQAKPNNNENTKSQLSPNPYMFSNIYEKSKGQLNYVGNIPQANCYLGKFLPNNPKMYKVNNINLSPINVVDEAAAKQNIQDIPTARSLIMTNPFNLDMPGYKNKDNDLYKFSTLGNNKDSKPQFTGIYVPDDNYSEPWKTLAQDPEVKVMFPYLQSNALYGETRPIVATQVKNPESFKFEAPKEEINNNILSKFIDPLAKVTINKDLEPVKYNDVEYVESKKLNDIKQSDNNESPYKFNDERVNPVSLNNNNPLQSAVQPPETFDAFNILKSNTIELETEPRFYPYFNNQVSQTDSSNAYNPQNLQLAKSNSNIPPSSISLPTFASSKITSFPLSYNVMSSPYKSADSSSFNRPNTIFTYTSPSQYNYQYLASPNSYSSPKSSNILNPYSTILSSVERSNSPSALSTPLTIDTSIVTQTSDLLNNIDTNDNVYNWNNNPEIKLPIGSFGVADYNSKENEKYLNVNTNTVNPFKCIPSIERSNSQNSLLMPPITNLSTDTKSLTYGLLNYLNRDDIKQNLYNNPAIAIPLGSFGVAKYDPDEKEKYFNVKTDNNDIDLKAWYSILKTVNAKLTFEVDETEVLNFLPIAKNKSKYTPQEIQNISKDAIRRKYGEPIEMKGVYSLNSPYAFVNNFDNTFNNRRIILWPTFCDCGCQKAGCECYWHTNRYGSANL